MSSEAITQNDLKAILDAVLPEETVGDTFAITEETSARMSTAANTNGDLTITFSKSGYYPLGIVGYSLTWYAGQTALINLYQQKITFREEGGGQLFVAFRNMHTATTQWEYVAFILWVKV